MTTRTLRASTLPLSTVLGLGLALVTLPGLSMSATAQATAETAQDAIEEPPAIEAPPELRASDQAKLDRELKNLRNSKAKARRKTEDKLIRLGRGAIPGLLEAMTTDHLGKQDGLLRCLNELCDLRDRELVAEQLQNDVALRRRFAAAWIGQQRFVPLVDALRPLTQDDDELVRFEAALSLASLGEPDGLAELLLRSTAPTGREVDDEARELATLNAERAHQAVPPLAGRGSHKVLVDGLKRDERLERDDPDGHAATRRAAVQLLASIGDATSRLAIQGALDDPHNLVQRDAINALRLLIEDKPPFEGGSIFAQLKEVDRLKKLGTAGRSR